MQVGGMDYWRKKREAQIKVSPAFSKAVGSRGKAPGRAPQGAKYLLFSRGAQNAHSRFGIIKAAAERAFACAVFPLSSNLQGLCPRTPTAL